MLKTSNSFLLVWTSHYLLCKVRRCVKCFDGCNSIWRVLTQVNLHSLLFMRQFNRCLSRKLRPHLCFRALSHFLLLFTLLMEYWSKSDVFLLFHLGANWAQNFDWVYVLLFSLNLEHLPVNGTELMFETVLRSLIYLLFYLGFNKDFGLDNWLDHWWGYGWNLLNCGLIIHQMN